MTETTVTAAGQGPDYAGAADRARAHRTITINFEGLGAVRLPPSDELAFLGGIGVLAAVGIIEWPLAGVLAVGHLISRSARNNALKAFGEALEEV